MGLDTSHNCWNGSYSGFNRWRNELARAAGYWVCPMNYGNGTWNMIILDWGHLPFGHLWGEWDKVPDDPLLILFTHSDSDGKIKHEHCGILADALEKLIPMLPDESASSQYGRWREKTLTFVVGLRAAHAAKEDVDFH